MTSIDARGNRWAASLAWIHAVMLGSIAVACYLSPETVFGGAAWLPLARLAVLLLGAALLSLALVLIGSAVSGTTRQRRVALGAALTLDAQLPFLVFLQPASLEYWESGLGIPWPAVPSTFTILAGLTVHCLLQLRRADVDAPAAPLNARPPAGTLPSARGAR
jgi:hypothetical protein